MCFYSQIGASSKRRGPQPLTVSHLSSNTVSATSNQLVTVLRATCGQETEKTTHNTWPKGRNARQPDFTCLIRTRDHLSLHTCPTKQSKKMKLYTNQMHQQECTFIESLTSKLRNYQKNMDKCQIIFVNIYPPPPPPLLLVSP